MPKLIWEQTMARLNEGDYPQYRIPGIAVTDRGTLLCVCVGREDTRSDWGRIDILLMRSKDDGQSWHRRVIDLRSPLGGGENDTFDNPTLIADGGRIHLLAQQNYARLFHLFSDDDGKTWSAPEEITGVLADSPKEWNVCAPGPGHGIVAEDGRLVVPMWFALGEEEDGIRKHWPSWAGSIHSDDHGRTWHLGALTDEFAVRNISETAIAPLSDGRILFNLRNEEPDLRRRLAWSQDGGETLSEIVRCDDLPDSICFGSMAPLPGGGVAFAGCLNDGDRRRVNLSVSRSMDGGRRWERWIHVADEGGYSDIAILGNALYIFYETTCYETHRITQLTLRKYGMSE